MGAVCYADDVLLIAPSRTSMQRMLYEIERFAEDANILFSTDPTPAKSKTKCIYVVGNKRNMTKPAPLILCGRTLPYVRQADHLGNILTEEGNMDQDTVVKRAEFIQSSVCCSRRSREKSQDLLQQFLWFQFVGSWRGQGQTGVQCLEHFRHGKSV